LESTWQEEVPGDGLEGGGKVGPRSPTTSRATRLNRDPAQLCASRAGGGKLKRIPNAQQEMTGYKKENRKKKEKSVLSPQVIPYRLSLGKKGKKVSNLSGKGLASQKESGSLRLHM